jgi:hypothetical protein
MDTDLFQTLAIVLLAVITALAFLAYIALARLRKVLEERAAQPTFEQPTPSDAFAAPATAAATPQASAPSPAAEERPEDERAPAASAAAATEPAADEAAGPAPAEAERAPVLRADEGREEQERAAVAAQAFAKEREQPAEERAEPVGAPRGDSSADVGTAAFEEVGAEAATGYEGYEDEPQEQPFERDGRWWFRRGDELLVYDEQTGQWMPAPSRTASGVAASEFPGGGTAMATETRTSSYSESVSGRAEARSSESAGGFWKCQSCGAVNGSTATSCRMCFSPRP